MGIEQKELKYAKEIGDVMVLAVELIKDLKAKKDMASVAAENLPLLMAAVDKADQIDDEVAADKDAVLATVGYHVGELAGAFLKKEAAPVA